MNKKVVFVFYVKILQRIVFCSDIEYELSLLEVAQMHNIYTNFYGIKPIKNRVYCITVYYKTIIKRGLNVLNINIGVV